VNPNPRFGKERLVEHAGTDAEVMAETRSSPVAFAVIFDRHFDTIHRYVDRRAGRDAADDLAGEVFRIAFEQRRRFKPTHESALPWLYGLATNVLLKHWRAGAREERALERIGRHIEPQDAETSAADSRLDAEPIGRRLAAALAELPQRDRDVVILIAWEELSYEEVAAALAIPEGTVRSRLNRARRALRAALTAELRAAPLGLAAGKDAS
jgi:RNA polymerase sigma-70 factor (ECF subfamily)